VLIDQTDGRGMPPDGAGMAAELGQHHR
jgi:hypothetical protein